ncbi:hypothetical protein [Methylophilus sp. DW102]|uniref:hypothetical protein n=1 Tax=Methylophilus sp. DW102 TaxID=3095607 RepID=UPI00308906A8|nr:DNA-binding protein [Methylophilus sp. DW102]
MAPKTKTPQEVKQALDESGKTIAELAKEIGVDYRTTYAVVSGLSKGRRGAAHKAAVALGIKRGV